MTRKNAGHYFVKRSENVTITVKPISVAPLIGAARSGGPLIDQTPNDQKFNYEFRVSESVGKVVVAEIAGQFTGTEPATARYEITVTGDKDAQEEFKVPAMQRPSKPIFAERSRALKFEVVTS